MSRAEPYLHVYHFYKPFSLYLSWGALFSWWKQLGDISCGQNILNLWTPQCARRLEGMFSWKKNTRVQTKARINIRFSHVWEPLNVSCSMLLSNIFLFFFFILVTLFHGCHLKCHQKKNPGLKNKLTKNINLHSTKDTFAVSLFFIVILLTYETSPQWVKIWQETALSSQHQKNRSSSDNVIWVEDLCYKM